MTREPLILQGIYPPNIDQIRKAIPTLTGREIFAWHVPDASDIIYTPHSSAWHLPVWLVEHEKVHFKQQAAVGRTEDWWDRFLLEPEWRFEQELEAHRREYQVFCQMTKDRNKRAKYLSDMSWRLSGPTYGNIISFKEARRRIQ